VISKVLQEKKTQSSS